MAMLEDVFEQSTDAVFGIDTTNRIRFANSMFERLMGYSRDRLYDKQCAKILCGNDLCGLAFCGPGCPIPKTTVDQPSISDFDLVVKHADGHDILVNIGASYIPPHLKAEARQVGVFFSMRQVDPQRMLQRMAMTPVKELGKIGRYGSDLLTPREKEILDLAVKGRKTTQIADGLSISTQTVRTHFRNIYQKLGVSSRTEAVIIALQQKLI